MKDRQRVYVSGSSNAVCSGLISGTDDDGGRISGEMCPSTGSPYSVVVFSRHQYERALVVACDVDRPAACVSQKCFELASKIQNRRRGHGDGPVF
jgi:hypothetical protein